MTNSKIAHERKKLGLSQEELASKLKISQKSISKYECGTRRPSYEILLAMSSLFGVSTDYLLGREDAEGHGLNDGDIDEHGLDGPGITDILGYPEDEEKAVRFSHKLALQFDFSGAKLTDVAESIGVTEKIIWEWLTGKNKDYTHYYKELSEYFGVEPSYWIRPGALSPCIEPTTQEYLLILRYRFQNLSSTTEELPIESFFPNCRELSESELKWLNSFRQLGEDDQDIIIGEIKKCLKEQRRGSVAADELLKKTGTDNLGK